MTSAPRMAANSPFDRLYTLAEIATMPASKRHQYEASLMHYWDTLSDKETTRNRLKRERTEGRAEGRAEFILKLISKGKSVSEISELTDLTVEEIERIIQLN